VLILSTCRDGAMRGRISTSRSVLGLRCLKDAPMSVPKQIERRRDPQIATAGVEVVHGSPQASDRLRVAQRRKDETAALRHGHDQAFRMAIQKALPEFAIEEV